MRKDIEALRKIVQVVLNPGPATYHPVSGVTCPVCKAALLGREMGITKTCPWSEGPRPRRERYHTCPVCTGRFKSVEEIPAARNFLT